MTKEQETVELKVKIDALQREYRGLNDLVNQTKGELQTMEEWKGNTQRLIDQEKGTLTAVLNQIAEEKLSWNQQRETELAALEEQKNAANVILAREASLEEREQKLQEEKNKVQELLKEYNSVLDSIEKEKTVVASGLRQIEDAKEKAEAYRTETQARIDTFKKNITSTVEHFVQEIEFS